MSRWSPTEGESFRKMLSYLVSSGRVSESSIYTIKEEALRILGSCGNPSDNTVNKTGLVCGYVQSGKTLSMTTITALARDNGFRVIIFIAGGTKNLVEQTWSRITHDLRKTADPWSWLMLRNPRGTTDRSQLEAVIREWRPHAHQKATHRTLVVTVMKNHIWLQHLAELFSSANFSGCPVIIFDDEADQASLNTRPKKVDDPSATYDKILRLRSFFPHHTYLQYTATPQAPLLISRVDSLSSEFAELVSPGESYTGGDAFFGPNAPASRIVDIPYDEICDRPEHISDVPPPTLLEAMRFFMLGVAIGELSRDEGHRSMLVHPSQRTVVHDAYFGWCVAIRDRWAKTLLMESGGNLTALAEEFRDAVEQMTEVRLSFNDILSQLALSINRVVITKVNKDGEEVVWDNAYAHLLVGGEKLGRGYTVEGLTVTYMPRGPGGFTADTIQQRARFFGYRADYIDLCKVYLHPEVRDIYEGYLAHEEHMRRELRRRRNTDLRQWKRAFYLDFKMKPTRHNVLTTKYLRARLNGGWFVASSPYLEKEAVERNRHTVTHLISHIHFVEDMRHPRHRVATVRLRDVFSNFLVPLIWPAPEDAVGSCAINCHIADLLEVDQDAKCVLYWMDGGMERRRTIGGTGRIKQLFQGRSSAGANRYPGDRDFYDESCVTVQLHNVQIDLGDEAIDNVPTIAIRIPEVRDTLVQLQ